MKTGYVIILNFFLISNCLAQDNNYKHIAECKDAIIDEGLEIGFILADKYIIHGYVDTVYTPDLKIVSFCRIMDCNINENIAGKLYCVFKEDYIFCLPFKVEIEKTDSVLNITHYGRLPYGKNWLLLDIPVYEQSIFFNSDTIYKISEKCILKPKNISKQQHDEAIKEYLILKGYDSIDYLDTDSVATVFLKLFLCAIDGYTDCSNIFINLERNIPGSTVGLLGDIYWRWIGFYYLYNKLPLPPRIYEK